MKALKVLIAEDDKLQAERLEILLEDLGYDVVGVSDHPGTIRRIIDHAKPDLVLMDIHLGGTIDGVDLIRQGEYNHDFALIYITSMADDQTIGRMLDTLPEAYLVKPVSEQQLQSAIELALYKKGLLARNKTAIDVAPIQCDFDMMQMRSVLFVKIGNTLKKFKVEEVLGFMAGKDKYSEMMTLEKKYPIRKTLNEILEELGSVFERVHRSYLVNINHIQRIEKGSIVLSNQEEIPLSANFKSQLEQRIKIVG